jgi:hypothetical protein
MCRNLRFRMCQKTSFFECGFWGEGRNAACVIESFAVELFDE